ncbi:response regulator [Shewanella aestuarii]|uniref:histidine kinase n=1 Tax=Shewanella aestuarii TaxID=1028752 RepID=A0A6G9QLN1_9GAMM|nr:response regulator [Shewanella aestuarii]QIR14975.1 response regulator [Shewanella aestuarii]
MKNKIWINFNLKNSLIPIFVGIALTLIAAGMGSYDNQHNINKYLLDIADKTENLIRQRFEHYEYGLVGTKATINSIGVDNITRKQMEKYIRNRNLDHEFPGALGFGFIRRVSIDEENEFITKARADDAPNFSIRTLTPHETDRFVIQYIFPVEGNSQAVGLDIGSELNRRTAAIESAQYNRPFLTAPITLVQADNKKRMGALVLLPIYAENAKLSTPEERENAVVGWSYAPLIIDTVLDNLDFLNEDVFVSLTNKSESKPFFVNNIKNIKQYSDYVITRNINVLGQSWAMEIKLPAQYIATLKDWNIGLVIILGLVFTTLLVFTINLLRSEERESLDNIYNLSISQSFKIFLNSFIFRRTCLVVIILLTSAFVTSVWLILKNNGFELQSVLEESKQNTASVILQTASKYEEDVKFLTSSVKSQFINADKYFSSFDDFKFSKEILKQSIQDIFHSYLSANKEVYQVRFISEQDWHEFVKLQQTNEGLRIYGDNELQSKKNESYINQTLLVGEGNVFKSDINLNREYGIIEQPIRPVWRFSSPVFKPDGELLGIVIINVNADLLLNYLDTVSPKNINSYVADNKGNFLKHPIKGKAFAHEFGYSESWQQFFELEPYLWWQYPHGYEVYTHQGERFIVGKQRISLSSIDSTRYFDLYLSVSEFVFIKKVLVEVSRNFILFLFLFLLLMIIRYYVWFKQKITFQNLVNEQNELSQAKTLRKVQALLDASPDAILVIDKNGIVEMANSAAASLFGYKINQLEGESVEKFIPQKYRHEHASKLAAYVKNPQKMTMAGARNVEAIDADGNPFPVEINLNSVVIEKKLQIIASIRDVTEKINEQNKLNKALFDAESATLAKSQFLANTSHEIRTPLNAIIGLSYLLNDNELSEEKQSIVNKIILSGKSLLGIINDVLDLAKIEANSMQLDVEPLELIEFIEEIADTYALQANTKNLKFNCELAENLPVWVNADSTKLRQILVNLLGNALKFTSEGSISLCAETVSDDTEKNSNKTIVRISVTDTGIGLSDKEQALLFQPFTQVDSSTTRKYGGTGLGLSIVYELVKLMNGNIGIKSEPGEGCQFWVDIPLQILTNHQILNRDNSAVFVLIAEDDPTDADIMRRLASSLGWRSEVVSNGAELVDAYVGRYEKQLRLPDAIIVDWQMPAMDGIEAIMTLKQRLGPQQLPAVLMISSHDRKIISQHDPEKVIQECLEKPVNSSTLFNAVNEVVSKNTGNRSRVINSTRMDIIDNKWLANMCILLVDDRSLNLEVLSNILKRHGAITKEALSGEDALTCLEANPNQYDVVLMDIQMPGIGGLEATRRIRNSLGLTSLPIIALTAGALTEERKQALEAGMNDFLTKPIEPSKVIQALRMAYESYRGKEIGHDSISINVADDNWPEVVGLNIDKAKELMLGDKTLFMRVLDDLLHDFVNLMATPDNHIDNNAEARARLASQTHKLRSSAGMVGAEKLQQLAAEAEHLLRTNDEQAKETLIALSLELKALQEASMDILASWKKDEFKTLAPNDKAPLLQQELLTDLLQRLKNKDLSAIDIFDKHSESFRNVFNDKQFSEIETSIYKLDFEKVTTMLLPLIDNDE